MASRIQGITVEIGGDTTKLTEALKGVNSEIRHTQSQLRDVEKLLKLDPSNTELLAQKQRLLKEEVADTEEKLKALKTASKQANEALKEGTITKDQYDALQREIIETEQALEKLKKKANESSVALQKISATGTKFQEVGGKIEGVGKLLLPVSAAVTGIGVAGLKVATDFEKSMSGVQAITGATGEEFERLREKAIELGASTAFSSGEVAEAMTEMAKAGWSTTQIIDGMAGVLDATAASGENLGTVATIVADAITGFGLAAKDSSKVADLMTQAANSGTIGISDLGESYKYVAPLAQSMGLSIEDVTTALSAMSMAGIKGSQAGTALRTVLANMAKPSDTVASAMDALNLSITNSDGSFKSLDQIVTTMRTSFSGLTDDQKAYYATALAGKEGMSGLLSLLNLTQEEYDALSASMNSCTGAAGETAAVMQDNLQSKVEQLVGALESLAIKLSDYVIPFLTELVIGITSAVEWFTNLDPAIQKIILFIGGLIAVAGPLLVIIGNVISLVGTVMTLLPKLAGLLTTVKTAFSALSAVMVANPIGLVITAIAALVAAFIYLWNNCEEFRQFWIKLWEKIKTVISTAVNFIQTDGLKAFQNLWNGIKNKVSGIKNTVVNGFNSAVSFIKNLAKSAYTWGKDIIDGIVRGIRACISKVKNAVTDVANTIRSYLHFSVPDEGPLTDYESWMPDFMSGLAKGIEQSKDMVTKAVDNLAADMVVNPQLAFAGGGYSNHERNNWSDGIRNITNAITEVLGQTNGTSGDIIIPIYLGGTMLDEVIVDAQQRANLRSGGR